MIRGKDGKRENGKREKERENARQSRQKERKKMGCRLCEKKGGGRRVDWGKCERKKRGTKETENNESQCFQILNIVNSSFIYSSPNAKLTPHGTMLYTNER